MHPKKKKNVCCSFLIFFIHLPLLPNCLSTITYLRMKFQRASLCLVKEPNGRMAENSKLYF